MGGALLFAFYKSLQWTGTDVWGGYSRFASGPMAVDALGAVGSVETPPYYPKPAHGWIWNGSGFSHCEIWFDGYSRDKYALPGDIDGDGSPDLGVFGDLGPGFYVVYGDGSGCNFSEVDYGTSYAAVGDFADFDGDGDLDAAVGVWWMASDPCVCVYRNDGSRSFSQAATLSSALYAGNLKTADANGDGLPDVLGVGARSFDCWSCSDGTWHQDLGVRDITGDGAPDVVVGTHEQVDCCGSSASEVDVVLWENEGGFSFSETVLDTVPRRRGLWLIKNVNGGLVEVDTLFTTDIHFGDVDCDGWLDVIALQSSDDDSVSYITAFLGPNLTRFPIDSVRRSLRFVGLEVQDPNGDGYDDLLVLASDEDGTVYFYYYQGNCNPYSVQERPGPVVTLTPLADGRLWVGTRAKLEVYDGTGRLARRLTVRRPGIVDLGLRRGIYIVKSHFGNVKLVVRD